jgi:hypothetical protein
MVLEQDGQMLFEYTMRKPQSFTAPADRFFVIRLEVLYFSSGLASVTSVTHGLRNIILTLQKRTTVQWTI